MLYGLLIVIHIFVCFLLIVIILLQGGRGGLSEALGGAAAQSLFGGSAANVMTKITAACAAIFMFTCLSLAYLSTIRGRSVIDQIPDLSTEAIPPVLPALPDPSSLVETGVPEASQTETATQTPSEPGSSQ